MNIPSITAFANSVRNEEDAIQMLVWSDSSNTPPSKRDDVTPS